MADKCSRCRIHLPVPGYRQCEKCRGSKERWRAKQREPEFPGPGLKAWLPEKSLFAEDKQVDRHPEAFIKISEYSAPSRQLGRVLLIPDCHIPYHDQKAFTVMLKAAEVFKPDTIIILGDWMDFYCLSEFDKHPGRASQLDQELQVGNECLTLLDRLGATKKVYIAGNHEDRLDRYLARRAPEFHGMVKLEETLKLRERGWQFVPYKQHYKLGEIYLTHDTGRAGRYAAYQSMTDVGDNTVIGHTHRLSYVIEGNAKGKAHVGAMFGWLGDFEKVDYMHSIRAKRDWAHGFGVGYVEPNGVVHLRPIPIVEGACVIDGVLVSLARQ